MAAKGKRLCKWGRKDIEKHFKTFAELVKKPKYACKKCGRVANKKALLHDAVKL